MSDMPLVKIAGHSFSEAETDLLWNRIVITAKVVVFVVGVILIFSPLFF